MAKKKTNEFKLGRPATILWDKADGLWKEKTDKEISVLLETSYTNVFIKRKKLIAEAKKGNQPFEEYVCNKAKWTRAEAPKVVPEVENETGGDI